jgi:putative addiction module component (TIGR02574 family)
MSETAKKLKSKLLQLSTRDRAELAHFLLQSLDRTDPEAEAAWDAELAKRLAEIKSGKAVSEPAAKVLRELKDKYS